MERARHIKNDKKKFTWEDLEKLNVNELRGITNLNFDPTEFIGRDDDEDDIYTQQFGTSNEQLLAEKNGRNKAKSSLNNLQKYGTLRPAYYSPKIRSKYNSTLRGGGRTSDSRK